MIICSCGSSSIRIITLKSGTRGRMLIKCHECKSYQPIKGKLYSRLKVKVVNL